VAVEWLARSAITTAGRYELGPRLLGACFNAFDLDKSGFINRHEYLLFLAAVVLYDHTRHNLAVVQELRCRAVFHLYVAARHNN
jgi:hypothetical protein